MKQLNAEEYYVLSQYKEKERKRAIVLVQTDYLNDGNLEIRNLGKRVIWKLKQLSDEEYEALQWEEV